MTATDVTGFDAIFSTGFFATFSRFQGACLTKLHINTGEKAKNAVESLQWRRRPEIFQISVPCRGRTCPDWKLPAYSGAFLLAVDTLSLFTYNWSFFAYNFSFLTYSWSFAYNGQVRQKRALRDCKQRSLTVSKKAPTVSIRHSLRGSLLKGGYNNSLHVPLAVPTPTPTPPLFPPFLPL